jgi:SAM-dependent methyltransferase
MHKSSMRHMATAIEKYIANTPKTVVDVGSYNVNGTYRSLFGNMTRYIGLDMASGPGVDMVLKDPYLFPFDDASADLVVSGQAFEHIEFFWRTWLEMVRVVKPGGHIILIAPSRGYEHRFPKDCWRFYPDGFAALAKLGGCELLHVATDWEPAPEEDSGPWGDTVGVFRKPGALNPKVESKSTPSVSLIPHTYNRDVFSAHAESLSKLSARMVRGSEVLELGPASGYFTRILKDALNCKVDAIEIDEAMAAKAKPYCRDIHVADLDALDWNALWPERRYDAIIAADVLEHLRFPERALQALLRRLKPEGKLLISLPNIAYAGMIFGLLEDDFRYRAEGLLDQTHLRFFTRTTLEETLAKNGWAVSWRGEVKKDLYEAEFHTRLETWPSAVRDFVCAHPDRQAYQLLCECVPRVRQKDPLPRLQLEQKTSPQFASRLMWGASAGDVSYERGLTAFGEIGVSDQHIEWKLPEAAAYVRIRLADRPGFLRIHSISIQIPAAQLASISLDSCTLSPDVVLKDDALLLSSGEAWLALPIQTFPAGSVIAMQCGWPMSGDYDVAGQALRDLQALQRAHLEKLNAEIGRAAETSAQFERNVIAREATIAERDTQLAQRNAHAAHLETLVTERERIIVERDAQLGAANERAKAAEVQAQAIQLNLNQVANTLTETQAQLHAREQHIAELTTLRGWLRNKFSK